MALLVVSGEPCVYTLQFHSLMCCAQSPNHSLSGLLQGRGGYGGG